MLSREGLLWSTTDLSGKETKSLKCTLHILLWTFENALICRNSPTYPPFFADAHADPDVFKLKINHNLVENFGGE